jgi:hypothetical protein
MPTTGAGRAPGWPVALHDERLAEAAARPGSAAVSGNRLLLLTHRDDPDGQTAAGENRILSVARDGTVTRGKAVHDPDSDHGWRRALSPRGVAVLVGYPETGSAVGNSMVVAFDRDGVREGWPITIDGLASLPSFRPDGDVAVQVGTHEVPAAGSSCSTPTAPCPRSRSRSPPTGGARAAG